MIARLTTALQQVQGMTLYMQAAQDITIGARLSKTQYQFTLVGIDKDELNHDAPRLLAKLQECPPDGRGQRPGSARAHAQGSDRPRGRRTARHRARDDRFTLYDAFGQRHVARIYTALNQYYVILEVEPQYQLGPNALQRIYVLTQNKLKVPLSEIASLTPAVTPVVVNRQNQFPSVTLSFNLPPA